MYVLFRLSSATSSLIVSSVHIMQSENPMPNLPKLLLTGRTIDYAITNNLTPFISMQNHHSLVYREEEREMFPTLDHFGVGIIPWSPLARGLLTRPFKTEEVTTRGDSDPCVSLDALRALIN